MRSSKRKQSLEFPDRNPNIIFKIYLTLCGFVIFGFFIFIGLLFLNSLNVKFPPNSFQILIIFTFLKIWVIIFAYILPLGIIAVGLWSIMYKESAIKMGFTTRFLPYVPPVKLNGIAAITTGIFYLILGLILTWGVTGVLLSLICNQPFCANLPSFVKFF